MNCQMKKGRISAFVISLTMLSVCFANPVLTPGTWKNISPSGIDLSSAHYGSPEVDLDPSNPATLYLCVDMQGIWKTTDAGSTWTQLGTPSGPSTDSTTTYMDSPIRVAADPNNPQHLYATEGVRGNTQGFWVSTDGGEHWAKPHGFIAISKTIGTADMTAFVVDPADFNHVLVGSHQPWTGLGNAGILETKDGGVTFVAHQPDPSWGSGTMGINFLYEPTLHIGNANTWLVGTDGVGLWRTTDGGNSFTRVTPTTGWPNFSISHGGHQIYYTKAGVLYAGTAIYPCRSTDNGLTWTMLSTLPYSYYYTVQGDGNNLYTAQSFADHTTYNDGFYVSAETDGLTWTKYQGGAQKFADGPFVMRFDKVNRIMYASCWNYGLWALKVIDPVTSTSGVASAIAHQMTPVKNQIAVTRTGISIRSNAGRLFDIKGRSTRVISVAKE